MPSTSKRKKLPKTSKLVYPISVSTGARGQPIRGTKAFAHVGEGVSPFTRYSLQIARRALKEHIIHSHTLHVRDIDMETRRRLKHNLELAVNAIVGERHRIARKSSHYAKFITLARKRIRQKLLAHQIPVEEPIEDLFKSNTEWAKKIFSEKKRSRYPPPTGAF